jgi:hypothetical protein
MIDMVGTPVDEVRRKFRSASSDDTRFESGNIRLRVGKGRSGCKATTIMALTGMKIEEITGIGEAELIIGQVAEPTYRAKRRFLFGNCANELSVEGYRIRGCPPPSYYVKKCLKGEEDTINWETKTAIGGGARREKRNP